MVGLLKKPGEKRPEGTLGNFMADAMYVCSEAKI